MEFRDRILELRRVVAATLKPNPRNWRQHPLEQREALRGMLAEVGFAGALLARVLPDGELELIDGHMRAGINPAAEVPVLVLDVSESEADKLLATLDPLAAMAEPDEAAQLELLARVKANNQYLRQLIADLAEEARLKQPAAGAGNATPETLLDQAIQLRPAREYIVVMCADDGGEEWERLKVALNLQPVRRGGYKAGSTFDQVGTQRVVFAADLLARMARAGAA